MKPPEIIGWIAQRLRFKHKDELAANSIHHIFSSYTLFPKKISPKLIEKLCLRHYPDFNIDRTKDLNIGYTNEERVQIKHLIIDIIEYASTYEDSE